MSPTSGQPGSQEPAEGTPSRRNPPTRTVALRDGTQAVLRLARPEDAALLDTGFAHLSEHSRYSRFFTPMRELSDDARAALVDVDETDRVAIIALVDDQPAGVGRYFRSELDPRSAELAVTVIDQWQGFGLGRALVGAVLDHAATTGVEILRAETLTANRSARRLFGSLGGSESPIEDDPSVVSYEWTVDPATD